ncbi:glycosyl hydrolase [Streptomyces sp. S.PNR 29]|uniref:glycoside hydrolase family 26 protein n=1 Tax=Streptomyces sp. S.PNR 29 TaxID=2973805 RepID=UPI0025AFA2EE|nr:glycosyl hydrolase [Streptomyces sp. S.PNR 29]MDN0193639.1 glycoside hydrolase family 26 protein [Streptomyces sp. S.PNR 29]
MRFARPLRRTTVQTVQTVPAGRRRKPKPGRGPAGPPAKGRRRLLITSATVTCAVMLAVLALRNASGPDPGADTSGARCRPTALLEPPCGAWFGAFVPHDRTNLGEKVRAYEQRVGRELDIVYTYHDMSAVEGTRREGQLLTEEEQRVGRDHLLLLSWESKWWGGTEQQQPTWKQIADGHLDASVIDVQARRVKEYGQRTGKKVFLSFDLEMDTRTPASGSPEDYVKAYRHLHDRFRELGVDNVVWTWITTGYLDHADLMKRMYPGDSYVDWIGYNQYNYYRCHKTDWLTFAQTQNATHDWIRENLSDDKPLMLSEFGSAFDPDRPERQAEWYAQVPGVLKNLDGVKAALQWNYRDPGPHCDLAVANDEAWASLREAVSDPYLNQPST